MGEQRVRGLNSFNLILASGWRKHPGRTIATQGRTLLLGPRLGYVKHPFLGLLSPGSLDPGRCVPIPGVTCRPEKQIISSLPVRSPLPPFLQQALSGQIEDNPAVQWLFPAVLYFRCLADDCNFNCETILDVRSKPTQHTALALPSLPLRSRSQNLVLVLVYFHKHASGFSALPPGRNVSVPSLLLSERAVTAPVLIFSSWSGWRPRLEL